MFDFGVFRGFKNPDGLEPFENALRIFSNGGVRTAVKKGVISVGVDVHFAGNSHFAELAINHIRRRRRG